MLTFVTINIDEEYRYWTFNSIEDLKKMLKPLYFIRFDKKGNVMECKFENSDYGYDEGSQKCRYDCNKNTFMYVTADTAEAAIKIGAERRAKFLAE